MNDIQFNPNAINWGILLNQLNEAAGTQGTSDVTAGSNITVTAKVDGVERTVTFPVPDDLEMPDYVDQAAIDSLCEKLAADTSLGLTEADIKAVHTALTETLTAISTSVVPGSKAVMFDLYKLMALLVEVGQKQRDAARETRSAQNAQIQQSIQNQADRQRTAALTGMIAGALCCLIQVIASGVMIGKQSSALKEQTSTMQTSGVTDAKARLNAATTELKTLKAIENPSPEQQARITTLKDDIAAARKEVELTQTVRSVDEKYIKATHSLHTAEARIGIVNALGNTAQSFVSNLSAYLQAEAKQDEAKQAKEQDELDQTKDLYQQAQSLVDAVIQLMQAVRSAETQSMHDAIQA